jgi:hypothetical protein
MYPGDNTDSHCLALGYMQVAVLVWAGCPTYLSCTQEPVQKCNRQVQSLLSGRKLLCHFDHPAYHNHPHVCCQVVFWARFATMALQVSV